LLEISDRRCEIRDATFAFYVSLGECGWRTSMRVDVLAGDHQVGTPDFVLELPPPEALAGRLLLLDEAPLVHPWSDVAFLLDGGEPVREARLALGTFAADDSLPIVLTGFVDLEREDGSVEYDLPLHLAAALRFGGVIVDEAWPDKARARLEQFFDPARFDAPTRRADGAHVFSRKATP